MTRATFAHTHRDPDFPGTMAVHLPDGSIRGYIEPVRIVSQSGASSRAWRPQDEQRQPLTSYCETQHRALEWVVER